jgi:hypothetical protein
LLRYRDSVDLDAVKESDRRTRTIKTDQTLFEDAILRGDTRKEQWREYEVLLRD